MCALGAYLSFVERERSCSDISFCISLLNEEGKSAVVSLAPVANDTYMRLAMSMGFNQTTSGNEQWLEFGFEDVNIGHW